MECPSINNLKLDTYGQRAMQEIADKRELGQMLNPVLVGGTFMSIFLGSNTWQSAFSVASTDWSVLANAIQKTGSITRKQIELIAGMAALESSGHDQKMFFRAIESGCKL